MLDELIIELFVRRAKKIDGPSASSPRKEKLARSCFYCPTALAIFRLIVSKPELS